MGKRQLQQAQFFQKQVDRLLEQREQIIAAGSDPGALKRVDTEIKVLSARIAKIAG